ncbi:O-methyltransferase [Aspergillus aurantiobrunneus]
MAAETVDHSPVDISIAKSPCNIQEAPKILKHIEQGINDLAARDDEHRKEVLIRCRALVQALETPRETMVDHCWGQIGAISAIAFGVDSGLWVLMVQNGDEPQRVADLAVTLRVDPELLRRLMRHLGAMGILIETGEDEYKPTNYSKSLSLPQIGHGYTGLTSCTGAGTLKFHEFSRKRGWTNPTDPRDTSLMYAYGTDKDVFSWVHDMGYGQHLNDYLAGYNLGRPLWMDPTVFPVKERLIDGADTSLNAAFLVDIGGNLGHDLERFHRRYPDAPGKLILQDLPMMIRQIQDLDPTIVRMEYDFHQEQPVKGARAYYIHSTLHNWPDSVCESILGNVKAAMRPGYSKLLINENVVPVTGAHWEMTGLDMMMLTLFSSPQRTSAMWYDLIEKRTGLKIVQIWNGGQGVESVIECELP